MASMALGVNVIELDPTNPDIVYAGTTKGLFRTANKGEQWERIGQSLPDLFVSSIVIHPTEPSVIYVGGPRGVWKSSDSGKTWQEMNQGLATLNVRSLAMAPKDSQTLYVGTNGSGLYRSIDAGTSWAPIPLKTSPPAAG
jgi:photosystem II stability/assembly factor-like uncharacterized protein